LLLVGHELIEKVDRATITPAHHRINQMLLQEAVEVSFKPRSLSGPAIEESAPGHRGSDPPLNYPHRTAAAAAAAHEDKGDVADRRSSTRL